MATAAWSVRVELAAPDAVSDDTLDELTDRLGGFEAAVAVEDDGHVAVQLAVNAGTLRAAFTKGLEAVTAAALELLQAEVVEVQVLTWAEFERRQDQPRIPQLWGVTEAAEFMAVSAPRIDQLVKEHPDKLPMVTKLAGKQGARIWLKSTWVRFERGYKRARGPKSPRAKAAAVPTPD